MKKQPHDRIPWGLTYVLILLGAASLLGIYSAQTGAQYGEMNFVARQALWYGVGFVIILLAAQVEPGVYKKTAPYLYGIGVLLLLAIAIAPESIAPYRNGAKRWFELPLIGSVQPSEIMKTFYIFMLAAIVSKHREKYQLDRISHDFLLLGKVIVVSLVPASLILNQPDLGTTLVFVAICAGVLIISGISWKILIPGAVTAVSAIGVFFYGVLVSPQLLENYLGIQPYQLGRVYAWLDPYNFQTAEGYNLIQALSAIGSGEMFGKGFQSGQVYIPEHHTDFIFTVFGEEFGFIGSSLLIMLFIVLIYHISNIALKTKDLFSVICCTGVISMLTFQVFQNVAMTIQLLPITGLTLPFISYGGSSLLVTMFAVGFVYSVHYHHQDYMFEGASDYAENQ